jgi:CMP-N,N'-diacetyllegionaminic acid synthase
MNEKINPLCTICARGGSKGVKNKNIRTLGGKPLIAHSVEQALATGLFTHVVISTDSDEIAESAIQAGAEVFFRRPAELSTDTAAKPPVWQHAFLESEKHYQTRFTHLVDLDATSPLRVPQDITNALEQLIREGNANLITAMPARRSPYFNLVETDTQGHVALAKKPERPIVRRQDAPACFDMNASIYVLTRDALLNYSTMFTEKTGLYVMPEERSIDIDSELDWKFVEFVIQERAAGRMV